MKSRYNPPGQHTHHLPDSFLDFKYESGVGAVAENSEYFGFAGKISRKTQFFHSFLSDALSGVTSLSRFDGFMRRLPGFRRVSFPCRHSSQSLQPSKTRLTKCQQNKGNPKVMVFKRACSRCQDLGNVQKCAMLTPRNCVFSVGVET